jgi:hypothetical protein
MPTFSNLDDLFKELKTRAKAASGNVPMSDLLTDSFIRKVSSFNTSENFCKEAGIQTAEEYERMPQEQLDEFVAHNTQYSTWEELLQDAGAAYMAKKMGLN